MKNNLMVPVYDIPDGMELFDFSCWCGCQDSSLLYDEDRWGQPLKTVTCRQCGTIRLNPRMSKEQAAEYYNRLYPKGQEAPEGFFLKQKGKKADVYLSKFFDSDAKILDYGCGPGGSLLNW